MDRILMLMGNVFGPAGCLPLPRGYIHVYFNNIEKSSPLKSLGRTSSGASLEKEKESLYR